MSLYSPSTPSDQQYPTDLTPAVRSSTDANLRTPTHSDALWRADSFHINQELYVALWAYKGKVKEYKIRELP